MKIYQSEEILRKSYPFQVRILCVICGTPTQSHNGNSMTCESIACRKTYYSIDNTWFKKFRSIGYWNAKLLSDGRIKYRTHNYKTGKTTYEYFTKPDQKKIKERWAEIYATLLLNKHINLRKKEIIKNEFKKSNINCCFPCKYDFSKIINQLL